MVILNLYLRLHPFWTTTMPAHIWHRGIHFTHCSWGHVSPMNCFQLDNFISVTFWDGCAISKCCIPLWSGDRQIHVTFPLTFSLYVCTGVHCRQKCIHSRHSGFVAAISLFSSSLLVPSCIPLDNNDLFKSTLFNRVDLVKKLN